MLEPSEGINATLWLIAAAVSFVPFIMFLVSYLRVRSTKLLVTTLAFFVFLVKSLILSMKLFIQTYSDEFWWSVVAILDISIIVLITIALLKKK